MRNVRPEEPLFSLVERVMRQQRETILAWRRAYRIHVGVLVSGLVLQTIFSLLK